MDEHTSFIVSYGGLSSYCGKKLTQPKQICEQPRWICSLRKTCRVHTKDGGTLSVHVYDEAEKQGAAVKQFVLFLHDFMTDKRLFHQLITCPELQGCCCLAPDLRGFGSSSAPQELYSRSSDLMSVVRAIGAEAEGIDVVGSGMGGAVALQMALEEPKTVRSVAAVSSGLPGHSWSSDKLMVDISAARLAGRLLQTLEKRVVDSVVEDATSVVKWKRTFIATNPTWSNILKSGQRRVAKELLEMARDYRGFHFFHNDPLVPDPFDGNPLIDQIANVVQPVLVLVGKDDSPDFRKIAQEIWGRVPNRFGEIIDIDNAGHFSVLERPEVVAKKLRGFWDAIGK